MSLPVEEEKKRSRFVNQLQTLTGETRTDLLLKAYDSCNGDLSHGIEYINNYTEEFERNIAMPDLTGRSLTRQRHQDVGALSEVPTPMDTSMTVARADGNLQIYNSKSDSATEAPVIDLTDEEAELQRAIKLSMECSSVQSITLSGEEDVVFGPDNSTASSYKYQPDRNPYLRRRISPEWPAGLKNLGNTCWFNSVIQSLFNLPVFRNIVLRYKPPSSSPSPDSEHFRNIAFMQEFRKLFVLLIGSNQSYINPGKCITLLKTRFEMDEKHQQQDVSEFTHKLLDWLEDAMSQKPASPVAVSPKNIEKNTPTSPMEVDRLDEPTDETDRNPMVDLFYGEYKAQGVNNGNSFTKPQKFGLFPLYVDGVTNLHCSLECTTRDRSHQDPNTEAVGQEHWFTKLPPVLIFELSRFHYNQTSGAPEKIHSRFDFPHLLYMDRYMETNAENTRQCRRECDELKEKLQTMREELKRRRKMTIGEKSFLIQDVLKCCTEFAASKRKRYIINKHSCHQTKRSRNLSNENPEVEFDGGGGGDTLVSGEREDTDRKIENATVVERCLKGWLDELQEEKEGLQDEINQTQARLDSLYEYAALKEYPYDLHAVLVHQGLAAAGHYWAYVKDHKNSQWLKCNDTDVRKSDWDELIKDSIGGGKGLTSAYCLMYIDRNREGMLMGGESVEAIISSDESLQKIIETHNMKFTDEMEEYDIEQAKIDSLTSSKVVEQGTKEPEKDSAKQTEEPDIEPSVSWNENACKTAIQKASTLYDTLGAEETVDHVVKEEWERLRKLELQDSTNSVSDARLEHVVVYMFRNKAPRKIIERALLEQFADDRMSYDNRAVDIMKCANDKLKNLSPENRNEEEYRKWHRDYRCFCRATCHLLQGLEYWQKGQYFEALGYLAVVKLENDRLHATALGDQLLPTHRQVDWKIGLKTISLCLEALHNQAIANFQKKNDEKAMGDGLNLLVESIIPWIYLLPAESSDDIDTSLLQRIRHDWCNSDFENEALQDRYECALQALMEPPTRSETQAAYRLVAVTKPRTPQDLCERFEKVMSTIRHR